MNRKLVGYLLGAILLIEAACMVPALVVALIYQDEDVWAMGKAILLLAAIGAPMRFGIRPQERNLRAREGFLVVALAWVALRCFGALPFVFSGLLPNYIDALFESVSGFTTTGATVLTQFDDLPRGIIFWRSFTHWVGGMGVLVFLLAFSPGGEKGIGFTMHLLRAESPGPDIGKLVPHIKDTAKILYILYVIITLLNILFLVLGKMPFFEAICTAFGAAGTGGFGIKNDSMASYSPYIQNVCTVFMLLFGVNFSCYYLVMRRHFKSVFKDEEIRMYFGIVLGSIILISLNIRGLYPTLEETIRHAAFQVSSIITTTGFATTDFDLWPSFSKAIILCLMVVGACAGSTGGGLKCGRALLILKSLRRNIHQALRPNQVQVIRNNGRRVDERVLRNADAYLAAYVVIIIASFIIVSLDGFSITTNFSAVLSCFNNIGPGLDAVGPTCNFSIYSVLSKLVLIADMLAGRLEIFPILVLFSKSSWKPR